MKDAADTSTIDFLAQPKCGRPSSGKKTTSASRVAAYRARIDQEIRAMVLSQRDPELVSDAALMRYLAGELLPGSNHELDYVDACLAEYRSRVVARFCF